MSIKLEGVAQLTAQLNEMGTKVAASALKGTTKAAMKIALAKAQAAIPIGSMEHKTYKGRLVAPGYSSRTLHIETSLNKRDGTVSARLGVSREAFYAVQFVELGTARMPARPWLRPAFEGSEDAMLSAISSELRSRIDKIRAKRAKVS